MKQTRKIRKLLEDRLVMARLAGYTIIRQCSKCGGTWGWDGGMAALNGIEYMLWGPEGCDNPCKMYGTQEIK